MLKPLPCAHIAGQATSYQTRVLRPRAMFPLARSKSCILWPTDREPLEASTTSFRLSLQLWCWDGSFLGGGFNVNPITHLSQSPFIWVHRRSPVLSVRRVPEWVGLLMLSVVADGDDRGFCREAPILFARHEYVQEFVRTFSSPCEVWIGRLA